MALICFIMFVFQSATSVNRAQSGNNDDLDESFFDRLSPGSKRIL